MPDTKTKRHIFKLHTSRMSLAEDVDLEELIMTKDDLSGADIKAVCSESRTRGFIYHTNRSLIILLTFPFAAEAGLRALRERRMRVNKADFASAKEAVIHQKTENTPEGLYL